jgi:uncharacterized LabA/DUF88 family protein
MLASAELAALNVRLLLSIIHFQCLVARMFASVHDSCENSFPMSSSAKFALFIDGANLHMTAKALHFEIDYKKLLDEFQNHGVLLRAFYYAAIVEGQEYSSIRGLVDWLDYNGFAVTTKAAKEFIDAGGGRKIKGNMDIELAVDAMEIAEHVDQMVLFSGDGDFRPLVEAVQRRGVHVTGFHACQPAFYDRGRTPAAGRCLHRPRESTD